MSVLWFKSSGYHFGIFWSLSCLFFDLRLLITTMVSFGHCIVCSLIYVFWLPLWYLLVIVLSVLWFTSSGYPIGIFWSLYCLFFDLCLLVTPLVSFGHCIVSSLIYVFWLPLWYLLVIVLSVLWFTSSDYPFGIFWSLHCLFFDLRLLITPLVSFGHCLVCSLIYVFWLPFGIFWSLSCLFFDLSLLITLWYLLVIALSVLWFKSSDYHFGIFWSLSCLFLDLRLLITLWYLLVIVLSVLWFTSSDYHYGIFWSLYCLFFDLCLLVTPLVSFGHCIVCSLIYVFWLPLWYLLVIVLSVLWLTSFDYPFGICWLLYCLFFDLSLLITTLVSFGHCIVCSLIYVFWLPLWYLLVIVLSVLWFMFSGYPFGFFWSLSCLFFDLSLLITPLVSFGHCIVCSLIYVFWLPLWYLLVIVLSVLWFTSSGYHFGILWSLYCLFFDLRLLITTLVSFGHCIVCSLIYVFWLPLWYLLVIVLSVLWFTSSGYPFGIFWSLSCLFFDLSLLITPLVSFGHCIVCSLIYVFWLPLWYLLVIVLSVLWFTSSGYPFGIFWSLYCLFFDLRLLVTPLVSFGHCLVCSLIYVFWLPLWYLLVIVLSVLWFKSSDYPFGIFWSLSCLFFDLCLLITLGIFWSLYCLFFDLRRLITTLVSFGHCLVWS